MRRRVKILKELRDGTSKNKCANSCMEKLRPQWHGVMRVNARGRKKFAQKKKKLRDSGVKQEYTPAKFSVGEKVPEK